MWNVLYNIPNTGGGYGCGTSNRITWINGGTDPDKLGGLTTATATFISFGNTDHGHKAQLLLGKSTYKVRSCYGDTDNSDWKDLWTSANDGSGSGLDADLLDGQHGSYYSASTHDHDSTYLKLSGGTMTGVITMPQNYQITWYGYDSMIYGNSTEMRIYTPGNLYINSSIALHSGNYSSYALPLSGGNMTGNINNDGEYAYVGYMPRKRSGGGGWAYDIVACRDYSDSRFMRLGVCGNNNDFAHIYLGSGDYSSENMLRIGSSSISWGSYTIWHAGNFTPSNYSLTSHNHDSSYLSLSGGTITGALETTAYKLIASNSTYSTSIALFSSQNVGIWNERTSSWLLKYDTGDNNFYRSGSYKIWDSGNDGSGSGLDADTLDGQQGSYYAAASSLGSMAYASTSDYLGSGNDAYYLKLGRGYGKAINNSIDWINNAVDPDEMGGLDWVTGTFISFGNNVVYHRGQLIISKSYFKVRACYGNSDNTEWSNVILDTNISSYAATTSLSNSEIDTIIV